MRPELEGMRPELEGMRPEPEGMRPEPEGMRPEPVEGLPPLHFDKLSAYGGNHDHD